MTTIVHPHVVSFTSPAAKMDDDEYAARRCAEQEILDRWCGLLDKSDAELIDLIADPPSLMEDADEAAAAAVVILERRLSGMWPRIHA